MRASTGDLLAARFWPKVQFGPDCWEWQANRLPAGYGQVKIEGRSYGAHRIAWQLTNGPIPDGKSVLHRCDNPPCVRPDHLFIGTQSDNIKDAFAKGRASAPGGGYRGEHPPESVARGSHHGRSKLTEDKVREIRSLAAEGWTLARLSERYGVRMSTLSYVIRRETWAHIA